MRVALINPPDPTTVDSSRLNPPLGLGYIASSVNETLHSVDIFDLTLERDISLESLTKCGLFDDYIVYGISSYSENFLESISLAEQIKLAVPEAVIVFGGYHATLLDVEVLKDFSVIDFVIRSEGEQSWILLLNELEGKQQFSEVPSLTWRSESNVCRNQDQTAEIDQNKLPFPIIQPKYQSANYMQFWHAKTQTLRRIIPIVSSRGCPKRCSFCSIIELAPVWRGRSVDSILSEIEERSVEPSKEHVMFQDANFFLDVKRTIDFCRKLRSFNPSITWSGTATVDSILRHKSYLEEVSQNCVYLEIGIESGNNNSLERFNKKTTVNMNENAMGILSDVGIDLALDFIMFEPEMSFEDLVENVQFLARNNLIGYWPANNLFQELRLFPGTALRDKYEEKNQSSYPNHKMPVTPLFDPSVAKIFELMQMYLGDWQMTTDRLIKKLNKRISQNFIHAETHPNLKLCSLAHATVCRLKHLPYRFLISAINDHRSEQSAERYWSDLEFRRERRIHNLAKTCIERLSEKVEVYR